MEVQQDYGLVRSFWMHGLQWPSVVQRHATWCGAGISSMKIPRRCHKSSLENVKHLQQDAPRLTAPRVTADAWWDFWNSVTSLEFGAFNIFQLCFFNCGLVWEAKESLQLLSWSQGPPTESGSCRRNWGNEVQSTGLLGFGGGSCHCMQNL